MKYTKGSCWVQLGSGGRVVEYLSCEKVMTERMGLTVILVLVCSPSLWCGNGLAVHRVAWVAGTS